MVTVPVFGVKILGRGAFNEIDVESSLLGARARALLPPKAKPVRSSRLTHIFGPPSSLVRLGRYCNGVGKVASLTLGNELNFMAYG